MHPLTSVLFANTSRLAPERRYEVVGVSAVCKWNFNEKNAAPLLGGDHEAPFCSHPHGDGLLHRQPRSTHLFSQSNFSSMIARSSAHRHPLSSVSGIARRHWSRLIFCFTDIQPIPSGFCQQKMVIKELDSLKLYPSKSIVLIMNPKVGLTLFTSSPMMCLTMVVFPALSRPLSESTNTTGYSWLWTLTA
jgi:hypothetical protein